MMKGKNIAFTLAAIAVFGGGFYLLTRMPVGAPLGASSRLAALEQSYSFGQVSMAAGKVRHGYKIENQSNSPVSIEKIYTSCMCTEAIVEIGGKRLGPYGMPGHGVMPRLSEAIAPGQEFGIEAVFDPAAHGPSGLGRISRTVTIETENNEKLDLEFSAEVVP